MLQMMEHNRHNELLLTEFEEKEQEDMRGRNCEKLQPLLSDNLDRNASTLNSPLDCSPLPSTRVAVFTKNICSLDCRTFSSPYLQPPLATLPRNPSGFPHKKLEHWILMHLLLAQGTQALPQVFGFLRAQ